MDGNMDQQQQELISQLTEVLKDSRNSNQRFEKLSTELQNIVPKLEQLQRDVLIMQADMKTQFVPRHEYEPRHKAIEDKLRQYDDLIAASRPQQETFIRMQTRIEIVERGLQELKTELGNLDTRIKSTASRALPFIATGVSVVALLAELLGHVQIR